MKLRERTVNFYEIRVDTISKDGSITSPNQTSFKDIINALVPFLNKGMEIGRGKSLVEVVDFSWNTSDSQLNILLNKADPELPDAAYKDRATKRRRNGNKQTTEDIELSSHAVLTASASGITADLAMTIGAGISPERIVKMLNDLYKNNKNNPAVKPLCKQSIISAAITATGTPVQYDVTHVFNYRVFPSTELKELLQTGIISGIELIENSTSDFDAPNNPVNNATIKRKTIGIMLHDSPKDVSRIKRVIDAGKKLHDIDADAIRLEYKDQFGEHGTKTLEVNKLEAAFTRSAHIKLDNDHHPRQTLIAQEIIDAIIKLK